MKSFRYFSMIDDDVIERIAQRMACTAALDRAECDAVLGLRLDAVHHKAGAYLVHQGAPCRQAAILLEGFAFSQIGSQHKHRQIVGVHLNGKLLDLHGALTGISGETVIAATDCRIAAIPAAALAELLDSCPRIGRALCIETLFEAAIAREWIMNIGQRSARQRLAHLCCELAWRSRDAGLGDGRSFQMPLAPEQLADATGLTRLHVNHSLQKLEDDGLILHDGATIRVLDAVRLKEAGEFDELYLCRGAAR